MDLLGKEVYYVRRYSADWIRADEEPFLFIKMERDYLYKIKIWLQVWEPGGLFLCSLTDKASFLPMVWNRICWQGW